VRAFEDRLVLCLPAVSLQERLVEGSSLRVRPGVSELMEVHQTVSLLLLFLQERELVPFH
jgi:hypothetical protein